MKASCHLDTPQVSMHYLPGGAITVVFTAIESSTEKYILRDLQKTFTAATHVTVTVRWYLCRCYGVDSFCVWSVFIYTHCNNRGSGNVFFVAYLLDPF